MTERVHHKRRTTLSARGEPAVWVTGMALLASVVLIVVLVSVIVVQGASTFWPREIERVQLHDGEVFLGQMVGTEWFTPIGEDADAVEEAIAQGHMPDGAINDEGEALRYRFKLGNKEIVEPFRWVPAWEIRERAVEPDAVYVERLDWGPWIGIPEEVRLVREVPFTDEGFESEGETDTAFGSRPFTAREVDQGVDGRMVRTEVTLASDVTSSLDLLDRMHGEALERLAEIRNVDLHEIGRGAHEIERWRIRLRQAERDRLIPQDVGRPHLLIWIASIPVSVLAWVLVIRWRDRNVSTGRRLAWCGAAGVALLASLAVVTEHPWSGDGISQEAYERIVARHAERSASLEEEALRLTERSNALKADDDQYRIVIREPLRGAFAPRRQTEPDEPLRISQIVRYFQPGAMSTSEKLGVYVSRWGEFLFGQPRMANTAGGVLPVIIGTVLLTILLSIAVVPLGVIGALYMREYAKQGLVTSILRIAINNLAGVPSIVYGVFGLGFFCYTVGVYIDKGPSDPLGRETWWPAALITAVVLASAMFVGWLGRPVPGVAPTLGTKLAKYAGVTLWVGAGLLAVLLVFRTPYFGGFYSAKLPDAHTFGARGLLWASLTLALLTLPVVIVATEEAIAAVPRSMREGSYGCGASKWQTIRRIVLPGAMPGILTGTILAMARGAGEVAPLMLVGAVKLAPEPPLDLEPPFIHLERSFMHLGFHIYDLGFQSPDAEAARPLVWTTTLLLISIVLVMNLIAVMIRARLRSRLMGSEV